MLEKSDCRSAGESVTVGVWDVFKIDLALVFNLLTVMVRAERGTVGQTAVLRDWGSPTEHYLPLVL